MKQQKRHIIRALVLTAALLALAGSGLLFADENTVSLESRVVQDFSTPEAQNWYVQGSKFSSADFPRMGFIKGGPTATLGGDLTKAQNARSLAVAMLFDRKEYNWVDVVPGTKEKPVELPLPGRVKMIDMWVWSGNFAYYLEAFVRDYRGVVYTIPMGDLTFVGWKNLRINIPDNVPQSKKYLPKREGLTFVKYRIWTRPTEIVAIQNNSADATPLDKSVKFYFNNMKVLTDTFEALFDGDSISGVEASREIWGQSGGGK